MPENKNRTKNSIPRFMIAAASSGSGKTLITCALLQILKDRGLDPVSFKCGPDYIDPMFHRTVLGIDSHNLDTFLAGEEGVAKVFTDAVSSGDHKSAVIEGVMGIYDGMKPDSVAGSCYEIAGITNTPIILVVNASGVGRTVISLIKGILADDGLHLIRGIILNRMSDAFYEKIKQPLSEEISKIRDDTVLLGHIPKCRDIGIESRHLGLKMPGEIEGIREKIRIFSEIVYENVDFQTLIHMTRADEGISSKTRSDINTCCNERAVKCFRENRVRGSALGEVFHEPSVSYARTGAGARFRGNTFISTLKGKTLAIARDEAFCFYYPENLSFLEECGCKLIEFSPIRDKRIPDGADALLFGGGYPELYLEELFENTSMLESIRIAIKNGMPSIAECGGFMYLHKGIEDRDKKMFDMVGVIDGVCSYTGHLVNFGYTVITEGPEDLTGMRGHEFHYYESSAPGNDATLCKPSTGQRYEGMYITSTRLWGWPHFYYRSPAEDFCNR